MSTVANQHRGLGWLPDVPSIKDYTATTAGVSTLLEKTTVSSRTRSASNKGGGRTGAAAAPALSPTVDLRPFCSPIEDQEALGSCTANAAAGLVEYFERKAFGKYIDASRLFIYKATRNLLGMTGDTGAYLRSTMGALVLFGAPPEQYWPYDISNFDVEPTAFCYAFAANFQSIKYFRLDPSPLTGPQILQSIKTYLSAGFPSMFGFPVYEEYMHLPADGRAAFPAPNSRLYGGHANVAVGYDDNLTINGDQGALLVRNSWGTSWGLAGYAWLSYRYVTEGLAVDWWSIIKDEWVNTGNF